MGVFDNITGGKAQKTIAGAYKGYRDQIAGSGAAAKGHLGEGYQSALSRYSPYAQYGQSGIDANQLYANALGVNGADARQSAFGVYQDDPFRAEANRNTENELTNMFSRYNAAGLGNSGASRLAVGRIADETARNDIANWLNRIQGFGNQATGVGMQTAGAQAGLDTGYGQDMANLETNMGNALAQSHLGHGQFEAQNANTGINNMMRFGELGAKIAAAAMGMPPAAGSPAPHSGAYQPWASGTTVSFG